MDALLRESYSSLSLATFISLVNGALLSLVFAYSSRVRHSPLFRWLAVGYVAASLGAYSLLIPYWQGLGAALVAWCLLATIVGYLPVVVYVSAAATASFVDYLVLRSPPDVEASRTARWRRRLARAARKGHQRKILEKKLAELKNQPTDPHLRRELIDLFCQVDDYDNAIYHAYSLVELLPRGHSHGFALYRLCQILVDRLGRLDAAQPYLRRILRTYPRSYFASYARRLINHYEAYADREL